MKRLSMLLLTFSMLVLTSCNKKECTSCHGSKEQTCISCQGNGQIFDANSVQPCNPCNRTGVIDEETCPSCDGTGKKLYFACVTCHETGKTPCKGCGGKGYTTSLFD